MLMQSGKPRKQRLARYRASMHIRQHFVHAHVSKELAEKLGVKIRALQLRKGDTVKVMAGAFKGKVGKVHAVSLKTGRAAIEGITRKNARGREIFIPISVSNLYIVDLDLSDKLRSSKIEALKAAQKK